MKSIDYTKDILKSIEYGGNNKKNQKEISASMLGNDLQQCLLRCKYGTIKENKVTQAGVGSLVHLGLAEVDFGDRVSKEYSIKKDYKDWILSGTIDRIDFENNMITDIKVSKTYTITSILNDPMHPYRLQLNMYRMLAEWKFGWRSGEKFDMQLEFYNKQGGYDYRKSCEIPDMQYISIDKIADEILLEKVDEIIEFVELEQEKQCDDVWVRKLGGKAIKTRCELYCSYKQVCSKYNPKPSTTVSGWDL